MNTQFEFDRLEPSNLRHYYEDMAVSTLRSIARRKFVIGAFVIVALTLAGLYVSLLPRKYTAEALIRPQLFSREEGVTPLASIDGASVVASEVSLIRSRPMVHAVVKRLGLDSGLEFAAPISQGSWGIEWVRAAILPETFVPSPLERAIISVGANLSVKSDTRSYLISISFTATSPETAASVANAFALEYLKVKTLQRLADVVTAANRELVHQSAVYGEKHPSMVRAEAALETARVNLQSAVNQPEMSENDIVPGSGITLGEPSRTPSGPKGKMILGLAFVSALISGVGLTVWLDLREARSRGGKERSGGSETTNRAQS
jgi:uncharacterized protein involved in exopolysaccharide biosynthesis